MQECDGLFWTLYVVMSVRRQSGMQRALRIQGAVDLTGSGAEVVVLCQRLVIIDNALRGYMLVDKHGGDDGRYRRRF